MVDSLIPEQEPEPDIRPSSRTINEHHQQRQPDGLNSVPPPNTNFTPVQDEEKSHHNTHPLVTTQTATSSISNTDSEKHTNTTPVLTSKDYATPASAPAAATDPTTGKPLRSILSRFKNRSSAQSSPNSSEKDLGEINLVSEPDEYKSPSVGGIGTKANWSNPELSVIDAKDNNTLPTPTRSNSAAPTTRRARHPYSSDPEALHARFAPDPNPGYPPYLNREALRRNDSGVGIHPARGPPPGPSIRDIGPPRPPKNIGELFTPDRKLGTEPTWSESLRNTVKSSYINYLVPFIPIAWALHFAGVSDTIVFVFSFIAAIPLASLLCFATEQLALRMGDALGGLLNATFGNAVELLISILALVKGEIGLVQASMIGSILSNTLLVLGMCYFAGGLRFHEQLYAVNASQLQISLLGISTCALVLPAAYHFSTASLRNTTQVDGGQIDGLSGEELKDLLSISRGMAFMLLAVYVVYLVFVLYTHAYLFKRQRVSKRRPHEEPGQPRPGHDKVFPIPHWIDSIRSRGSSASSESGALSPVTTRDTIQPATETTLAVDVEAARMPPDVVEGESALDEDDEYEEEEKPQVKALWAFLLLLGVTAITGVTAEFLIDSIDGLASSTGVSVEFIGLILLPLVGNAVEHVAAVTVSVKDKLNLSMAIAVGSSIQVSLGILPLLVLIGWAIGQPMSLFFDTFETITLAVSLLLVNFAIVDGRSNFCEGFVLMMAYAMIALVTWFYNPPH